MTNSPSFADDKPDESIEQGLVRALWAWFATPSEDAKAKREAVAEVAPWMEGFLCEAFQLSGSRVAEHWCTDDLLILELTRRSAESIHAAGVAYWFSDQLSVYALAPFECEFYFAAERDPECASIIVRFGALDESGEIAKLPITRSAFEILRSRPTKSSDWAFAVEIA